MTRFNFSCRVCNDYTFTVTPVNGAGNGTAVTLGYPQDIAGCVMLAAMCHSYLYNGGGEIVTCIV